MKTKHVVVLFGGLAVVAVVLYLILSPFTGDPRIVKHRGTEIVQVGKLRSITIPGSDATGVQFPGVVAGHVSITGLFHTTGVTDAEDSPAEVRDAPTEYPNYEFKMDAGKLVVSSDLTGDTHTVPLLDGGTHLVVGFDPADVKRLDLYTALVVETRLATRTAAEDPPKRRAWVIPNKRIEDWIGALRQQKK